MMNFKKLEAIGGIGSILTGFMCVAIGVMDYREGQAWRIWVIMTVVLVVNGIAMIRHSMKRVETPNPAHPVNGVAKART